MNSINFNFIHLQSPLQGSREEVLKKNFTTHLPTVHVFEQNGSNKISNYKIIQLTFQHLIHTKQVLKTVSYTVCLIALPVLGVGLGFLVCFTLKHYYQKIGTLFDRIIYLNGIEISRQRNVQYTATDFAGCFLSCTITGLMLESVIAIKMCDLYQRNPFVRTFKDLKVYYNNPVNYSGKIIQMPSPMAHYDIHQLANGQEDGQILDPIFLTPMPEEEIRSPRTLLIGRYALSAQNSLKSLFRTINSPRNGSIIAHPLENRYLTREEQDKLLNDLSLLLCIGDKQQLLNCWRSNNPEIRFQNLIRISPRNLQDYLVE